MTLEEARAYLEGANGKQIKLGLENMDALIKALNHPEQKLKIIHVTGTNGKGSVCEMMSQILQCSGYKVGVYNSPYFEVVNECIRINNEMIVDELLLEYMNQIEPVLKALKREDIEPSGFEILTALTLYTFDKQQVDFVILEVGLGGRLDATNVISQSELSVITKVALDHENFLGNTLEAIAQEKAGIIKNGGMVVAPMQDVSVMKVIRDVCEEKEAILKVVLPSDLEQVQMVEEGTTFNYKGKAYRLGLLGKYQAYNASIAIESIKALSQKCHLEIEDMMIEEGLKRTRWPGRFEKVKVSPTIFLDGAHNVDGILGLADTLKTLPKKKTIAIVGILADKEVDEMLEIIMPLIDEVIVTKPLNPRAMAVDVLADKIKKYNKQVCIREEISRALELSLELESGQDRVQIIGFGSLYMIGTLRKHILSL